MKVWCTQHSSQIISIVGIFLGTILGWILGKLDFGKLNLYVYSWSDKFFLQDSYGQMVPTSSVDETEYYRYSLSLDIYNSSQSAKSMRNIEILFSKGSDVRCRSTPREDSTKRVNGSIVSYKSIGPINIPGRTALRVDLHDGCGREDLSSLWESDKVSLLYKNERNKSKSIVIKREIFKDYFVNNDKLKENTPNGYA